MSPTLQFFAFIVGFLVVLGLFIRLIQIAEKRLNGNIARRPQGLVEGLIIVGIALGVALMFQPFVSALFEPGFLLLLACTLAFTLWSHIIPKAAPTERNTQTSDT